jgi:hypothetical protein
MKNRYMLTAIFAVMLMVIGMSANVSAQHSIGGTVSSNAALIYERDTNGYVNTINNYNLDVLSVRGIRVLLVYNFAVPAEVAYTNENGYYEFPNVPGGREYIVFIQSRCDIISGNRCLYDPVHSSIQALNHTDPTASRRQYITTPVDSNPALVITNANFLIGAFENP